MIRGLPMRVASTHYIIGSAVGPAPYPAIVRELQRTIGDEARAELLERGGRLPSRVIACVGGGSNAIGTFTAFVADTEVALVGVEAAGAGLETGRHGAPLTAGGRPGVLHGSLSAVLADDDALDAFCEMARLEGIIPALESSHAIAWALANPGGSLDLICLSGRGDKDLAEVLALRPMA